jgi:hypothetical protein
MSAATVELRCPARSADCPESMGKLLGKARVDGTTARALAAGLVELQCSYCERGRRAAGSPRGERVLHLFNLLGELVDTEIVPAD